MTVVNIIIFFVVIFDYKYAYGATSKSEGLFGGIIGDIAPSTYPVLKFNQSVNNNGSLSQTNKEELCNLKYQILKLLYHQRRSFENLRLKAINQTRAFENLANLSQHQ